VKIIEIKSLAIQAIKVIRYARFRDNRGYFSEHFRRSDLRNAAAAFMDGVEFVQSNESYSRKGTLRGLHFQWNPYMGKMVRTISGRMLDIVLDIRKGSPTLGKVIIYDMPANLEADYQEWLWVPPGFAHGNVFPQDTVIEYFCSGEYSQGCEAGISPYARDLDWSLSDPSLKQVFDDTAASTSLVTDKDRNGFTLEQWVQDPRSQNFTIEALP
jgi:dTDP-4-dehydrorhamnose 3,5-epimerase